MPRNRVSDKISHGTLDIINGALVVGYDFCLVLLTLMQENRHRELSYTSVPLILPTQTPKTISNPEVTFQS